MEVLRSMEVKTMTLKIYPDIATLRAHLRPAAAPPAAAPAAPTASAAAALPVHYGVECDKSHMNPIVGPRYHVPGNNYDLCAAEFDKVGLSGFRALNRLLLNNSLPHSFLRQNTNSS